jgi:hypothetical protein
MERRAIFIQGTVQGVGFRPFVFGLASKLQLGGFVNNQISGVRIEVGFDTATEVGLLGISAAAATQRLPIRSILLSPLLFTAGMCLLGTADGVLIHQLEIASGGTFSEPVKYPSIPTQPR